MRVYIEDDDVTLERTDQLSSALYYPFAVPFGASYSCAAENFSTYSSIPNGSYVSTITFFGIQVSTCVAD